MAKKSKGKKAADGGSGIAQNKKATHEYFIEERIEAGMALEGWEVKSIREKKVNITESYVFIKGGEAFLSGCNITPLLSASTHIKPEATRVRKLLLHRREIDRLMGAVDRKGYTLVALNMHWSKGRAKLEIGLGKGKKLHDKRASDKERDWARDKQRIMKKG